MKETENQCGTALIFLAKTFVEDWNINSHKIFTL